MSNTKDQISTQFVHRSLWEMSTSQKDQTKKVIHILGYANQALEQLSTSAYEWAIVRTMQQSIERQCINA